VEPLYIIVLLLTGIGTGFASGMLGVGGCFIMVPIQYWILSIMGIDPKTATLVAFGTSLAVAFPTAMNGALGHYHRGVVVKRAAILLGLSGTIGAFLGGTMASRTPDELLRISFGLMIFAAALKMTTETAEPRKKQTEKTLPFLLLGLPVGFICGLVGIGGGIIMVPAMTAYLGFRIHQAIGTSTAAIMFTSLGGTLSYVVNGLGAPNLPAHSLGYVNLIQWVLLAGTSIPMARVGVWAAHRLPAKGLKWVFITLMIYASLKMMGIFNLLDPPS